MLLNTTVSLNTRNLIYNTFNFGQIISQKDIPANKLLTIANNDPYIFSSVIPTNINLKTNVNSNFQLFYQKQKNSTHLRLYYLYFFLKKNKFFKKLKLKKRLKRFANDSRTRVLLFVKKFFVKLKKKNFKKNFLSFYFFFKFLLIKYIKYSVFVNTNNIILRKIILKILTQKSFKFNRLIEFFYKNLNIKQNLFRIYKKLNNIQKLDKKFSKNKKHNKVFMKYNRRLYFIKALLKLYLRNKKRKFYTKYAFFVKHLFSKVHLFLINSRYNFNKIQSFYYERFLFRKLAELISDNKDTTISSAFILKSYFLKILLLLLLSKKIF